MRVLIACEYSGRVREAFRKKGHDAWSCDILPADDDSKYHIQGNVLEIIKDGWDLMIAHPPCTYLTNSGVRWLHERPERWKKLDEGAEFFNKMLNAPIEKIAVENPIMHKYAIERIGRKQDFCVQPYEHGEPYTKKTCFWLKNLEPFGPTKMIDKSKAVAAVHKEAPAKDRWKKRSTTYQGIANAIAEAWG